MTREEAIKKVRQMSLPKETMEILEALAPELTESEDERIRKRLIEYFEGFRIGNAKVKWEGLTVQDVLAWLEKQKEQKPEIRVKIPKFRVGDIIQHIPLEKWDRTKKIVSIDECGYNYDVSHLGDTVSGGAIGFAFENEYELVEQKPAEWSEEDETMLKWIEDILLIADGDLSDKLNGKVSPITDSAYSSMKLCIAKCLSWLKSLKLRTQ